jgi:hypothetical protein
MLTNRNIVVAMLVAPILSVIAWWAVGVFIGEKPKPAQPGRSYLLIEQSNCRYASGECDLENADFKLTVSYLESASGPYLAVRSTHALDSMFMTVAYSGSESPPKSMTSVGGHNTRWRMEVNSRPDLQARIRLVASAFGSAWFGDAGIRFLQPQADGYLQR